MWLLSLFKDNSCETSATSSMSKEARMPFLDIVVMTESQQRKLHDCLKEVTTLMIFFPDSYYTRILVKRGRRLSQKLCSPELSRTKSFSSDEDTSSCVRRHSGGTRVMLKKVLNLCCDCQQETRIIRETEVDLAGYQLDRVDGLTTELITIVRKIDKLSPGFDTIHT